MDPSLRTILVVEDDDALRRLLELLLTASGYRVVTARDGVEGLEAMDAGRTPDAVVLDVMMPRLSGLSVCRELRARLPRNETPILLLTARVFDDDIQSVIDLGGIQYMSKPFDPTRLQHTLASMIDDEHDGTWALATALQFEWMAPRAAASLPRQ